MVSTTTFEHTSFRDHVQTFYTELDGRHER